MAANMPSGGSKTGSISNTVVMGNNEVTPPSQYYLLTLSIKMETKYGQYMCVVGSEQELGGWKHPVKMKWTEGHVWVLKDMKMPSSVFQYKYVMCRNDNDKEWESGYNRLADLYLLHQEQNPTIKSCQTASVQLQEKWMEYSVNFSIYYPLDEQLEVMRINGEGKELGAWNKGLGPQNMN